METLLEKTKRLLAESPETLTSICKNSGLNYHWLAKFHQGKFPNPGVNTIETLHNYLLSQKNREVA